MAKKIKIEALLPLLAYGLPQSEGQTVLLPEKQALEVIEAGYGKLCIALSKEKTDGSAAVDAKDLNTDKAGFKDSDKDDTGKGESLDDTGKGESADDTGKEGLNEAKTE